MKKLTTSKPDALPLDLLGDGATEDYDRTDPEVFVPSGLGTLDNLILGAVAGECLLIAGAPSQGKTALAVQWAVNAAGNAVPSAILSMEMGRRALRNRLISGMTGISMRVLRTREFANVKQRTLAKEAAAFLSSIPLYVDDRSGLDADRVYQTILNWKAQGIGLGIIDYLQLMSGANESRVTQVGDAIRAVKAGAKEADLPIIILSSLNRSSATADNRTPKLSDLRDSGDIEYVGDTILMFHYPEDDLFEDVRVCDIHVMKQRNGPTGVASVQFNKPATKFEEV
jgi:replicative DNA helicase